MTDPGRIERERGLRDAAAAGHAVAWQVLYESAVSNLSAYIRWRVGHDADARDAIQDVWLVAARRIADFEPARAPFAIWLRGIAAGIIRNRLRSRARHNGVALQPEDSAQAENHTALHVAEALAQLPEHYEQVLAAKYIDGSSVREIAGLRGESPKAVESLLTRAREAFREAYTRGDRHD